MRRGDGATETLRARAVISAVGQLNAPYVPDLSGAASFAGPAFHTARWDHDVDLTGRNVVMIGAGATGFQIAPAIAERVGSLTIFQRTAQWMFPNPDYHSKVGAGVPAGGIDPSARRACIRSTGRCAPRTVVMKP